MADSFYGRRDRRRLAKQLGLSGNKMSQKDKEQQRHRAQEAGKQIHMQFITEVENSGRKQMSEIEARQLKSLVDFYGEAEGTKKFEANQALKKK